MVEAVLVKTYQLVDDLSVVDFLVQHDRSDLRAATLFVEGESMLDLGVSFSAEIAGQIEGSDPSTVISNQNIDAFCVLIEEISHFHLIVDRGMQERKISKLELEWQAEIDKILVCASLLVEQTGRSHLNALYHLIYNHGTIISEDVDLYNQATRFAAKFWRPFLKNDDRIKLDEPAFHVLMRNLYRQPWQEKLAAIQGPNARPCVP